MPKAPFASIQDGRDFVTFCWELPDGWDPHWVCTWGLGWRVAGRRV